MLVYHSYAESVIPTHGTRVHTRHTQEQTDEWRKECRVRNILPVRIFPPPKPPSQSPKPRNRLSVSILAHRRYAGFHRRAPLQRYLQAPQPPRGCWDDGYHHLRPRPRQSHDHLEEGVGDADGLLRVGHRRGVCGFLTQSEGSSISRRLRFLGLAFCRFCLVAFGCFWFVTSPDRSTSMACRVPCRAR